MQFSFSTILGCFDQSTLGFQHCSIFRMDVFDKFLSSPGPLYKWITLSSAYWLTCFSIPLLADLFLYSYENEFLDKLIKEGKTEFARKFNLSYHYIVDLISFKNKRFNEFISDI